jgi:ribonuclease R
LSPHNKLSFVENIVYTLLSDQKKGSLNVNRIYSQLPLESTITKDQIHAALLALVRKNKARQPSKGQFQAVLSDQVIKGVVTATKKGELVLEKEDRDWVYLPSRILGKSIPGDILEVYFSQKGKRQSFEGVKLIQRNPPKIVGTLDIYDGKVFLLAPDSGLPDIELLASISAEHDGHKAAVRVVDFPANSRFPQGELIEIFGEPGEHHAEIHAIISEFGFSTSFPKDVLHEAEAISHELVLDSYREDYRKFLTFTIDPVDAKDFDDALSIEQQPDGTIEIGIHIADVAHYVKPYSLLDAEAANRATSVYLVDRTIPMLPEVLSNDLCSLKPNVDRYAFSVIVNFDVHFNIIQHRITKTLIHSDYRFSYESAQEVLHAQKGDYYEPLNLLNLIAKKLEKERYEHGALRFESKELRFILDENQLPTKVIEKQRFDTHKLIETFMLLANKIVAKTVFHAKKPAPPFIYRTHDDPPPDKLIEFSKFCKLLGYPIQIDNEKVLRASFNSLLDRSEGKPEQDLLQQMSIRTMAKAVYTGQKTSHFGLAFPFYTHFTSPIRRYPDLLAHRMLFEYLQSDYQKVSYTEEQIEAIAKHSSNREQMASDAERASIKYKLTELMKFHEGQTFEARITGVTEWGIYATVSEYHAEGLIRLRDIHFDRFHYIEDKRQVVGKRTKRTYRLGDFIYVTVKRANPEERTIDLILEE